MSGLTEAQVQALPEDIRPHFVAEGENGNSTYVFRPQGFVPKASHEEMLARERGKLKAFEGYVPPDKVAELERKALELEDQLKAGDNHPVVKKLLLEQTERMRADHEAKVEKLTTLAKAADDKARAALARYEETQVEIGIRDAARELGLHKHAVGDALMLARQVFRAREEDGGAIVPRRADGNPLFGSDGKSPMTYAEWLESQKTDKPHWWPAAASGAGTGEGRTATGNAKSMTRAEFNKLGPADQFERIKQGVELRD